jgi:integrase/recombinase XerD
MATLAKMRGKWYSRISSGSGINRSILLVPLKSASKVTALSRHGKVESREADIKSGVITDINAFFKWLNKEHTSKVVRLILGDAVDEWFESRRKNNIRKSTLDINQRALDHFVSCVGRKCPVEIISVKDVREYRETYLVDRRFSPTSINMYLRSVRSFFTWLVDNEYLDKRPKVVQVPIDEPEVKYLNETEVGELMRLDLSPKDTYLKKGDCFVSDWEHYKRAFKLYLTTGCRKSEPFLGEIKGMWLYIPPNQSKNRRKRTIKLSSENLETLQEMRERRGNYKSVKICSDSYNKVLKKALKKIGASKELTLHSLRHTYACIRRLQTNGNMPLIRDELGHKDIGTTQRYTEIPPDMLEQDFPTYSKSAKNADGNTLNGNTVPMESEIAPL